MIGQNFLTPSSVAFCIEKLKGSFLIKDWPNSIFIPSLIEGLNNSSISNIKCFLFISITSHRHELPFPSNKINLSPAFFLRTFSS